jgi:hypothetical protein
MPEPIVPKPPKANRLANVLSILLLGILLAPLGWRLFCNRHDRAADAVTQERMTQPLARDKADQQLSQQQQVQAEVQTPEPTALPEPEPADPPRYVFMGFGNGQTEASVLVNAKARGLTLTCEDKEKGRRSCSGSKGNPLMHTWEYFFFGFLHGKMWLMHYTFPRKEYDNIYEAMVEKYGNASKEQMQPVKNDLGEVVTGRASIWESPEAAIMFTELSPRDVTQSKFLMIDNALAAQLPPSTHRGPID